MRLRVITAAAATTIGLLAGLAAPAQAAEPGPTIHLRGGGEPGAGSAAA